jgi:phospholipid/cholesterol/gamma-HCH transport system permease protein
MIREMGPFMTGLIIAASVGSAIAAQLGTMTVSEEIAALEVMSINPNRFLVMPRLVALAVMMPILSVYTNILGILGGAVVGATQLGVSVQSYMDNATEFATNKDLYVGLLKAFIFGVIITTVSCHQGFMTTEGAVGVGKATRRSVIISFLVILVVGYMVTRLFYI